MLDASGELQDVEPPRKSQSGIEIPPSSRWLFYVLACLFLAGSFAFLCTDVTNELSLLVEDDASGGVPRLKEPSSERRRERAIVSEDGRNILARARDR